MFKGVLKRLFWFLIILGSFSTGAQVQLATNLPHVLPPNKTVIFEIQINKNPDHWYSRLEMRCDRKFFIQPGDLRGGVMEVTDTTAIIVWEVTPEDVKMNISLKLLPVPEPGNFNYRFSYFYQQDDMRRELPLRPFAVKFEDIVMPVYLSSAMEVLRSTEELAIPMPPVERAKVVKKSPAEVKQQVKQLKNDAKEAFLVGALEKDRINRKIDTLRSSITAIGDTTGDPEKVAKYQSLQTMVEKCDEELKVAERVLTLAVTLEAQANEIERISKGNIRPSPAVASAKVNPVSKPAVTPDPPKTKEEVPVSPPAAVQGRIYKIQIGAFATSPGMNILSKAGKIELFYENSVYKVLEGAYTTREEAVMRKQQLTEPFPGCFIVTFENGQRLK